ncbi:hypothetical protein SAMN04487989_10271 [Bizionia echini]|uniref:Uncharacterized protein n=1 Tax=Bizionia echini TaxID=649333 RepID=A0A1I5AIE4_9FLAO|nr:hypothetical protein [Bizionia echini]SFN62130.1 hypothetical protein SAMN04487989_10271 [Bizionia echini]
MVASLNDDFEEIVLIKNQFKKDVKLHPELEIFNMGMALVEVGQNKVDAGTSGGGGGDGCWESAVESAITGGILGMVIGGVSGGFFGVGVGAAFTFGILSIPAGGAGAIAGSVLGAVGGFFGGLIKGYISCMIFGGN